MGSIDRRIVSSSSRSLLPLAEFDWSSAAPLVAELGIERAVASQYYELRLSAHSEQVDYLCSFSRSSAALVRDALAHRISQHAEHRTNAWRAIQRFLCAWTDSESLCARRCSALWFEFDDYARQASGAVPSVSVCLTQNYSVDFEPPAQEVGDIAHAH